MVIVCGVPNRGLYGGRAHFGGGGKQPGELTGTFGANSITSSQLRHKRLWGRA